jgi:hypothetical protein
LARIEAERKFKETHEYNCLVGKYYDDQKEEEYKRYLNLFISLKRDLINYLFRAREEAAKVHGKDFINRFPPSWKFR